MTLDEHIAEEKKCADFYENACRETRMNDIDGVYGRDAQMYADKSIKHRERAELLEELEVYKKALRMACDDMNEIGIDPYGQIAIDEENIDKLDKLINRFGWVSGWVEYYLQKARKK